VRLAVRAAGASLLDALITGGKYQCGARCRFPSGLGIRRRGRRRRGRLCAACGVGDRVMASGFVGGFSQTAVVPAAVTSADTGLDVVRERRRAFGPTP
jgi:NADPH:quinone reductase-like Zn-dependent oxidoreductase